MNNTIIKLEDVDKFYMETGNKLHILKKLSDINIVFFLMRTQ